MSEPLLVKPFLCEAGGRAGRRLQDAAGGADGGCLCGPLWSVLCRERWRSGGF